MQLTIGLESPDCNNLSKLLTKNIGELLKIASGGNATALDLLVFVSDVDEQVRIAKRDAIFASDTFDLNCSIKYEGKSGEVETYYYPYSQVISVLKQKKLID